MQEIFFSLIYIFLKILLTSNCWLNLIVTHCASKHGEPVDFVAQTLDLSILFCSNSLNIPWLKYKVVYLTAPPP